MAMMPSSGSVEQPKEESLTSVFDSVTLSFLLACRHCNPFHVVLQLPYFRDGILQNEAGPPVFARKLFLRRSTTLFSGAQEAVCDQKVKVQHTGDEPLLSERKNPPVCYQMPLSSFRQMSAALTCERHSNALHSPSVAGHGITLVPQKGMVRRERSNAAAIHLRCYLFASSTPFDACFASSFGLTSSLYTFVFSLPEPLCFTVLQNVSYSTVFCRLVVECRRIEKDPRVRVPVNTLVFTNLYSERSRSDAGENTCLATTACASVEPSRIVAIRLLAVRHLPTKSGLVLLFHFLVGRGARKCFSVLASRRRSPLFLRPFPTVVTIAVAPVSLSGVLLQFSFVHANSNFERVKRMSSSVMSPSGRTTVARCVSKIKPISRVCSPAGAKPPSDPCLRGTGGNIENLAFGLPGDPWRRLSCQFRNLAFFGSGHGYAAFASMIYLSFFPAAICLPSAATRSWRFRLPGLLRAASGYLSSAIYSCVLIVLSLLCDSRKVVAYVLEASFSAATFPLISLMPFSHQRRKLVPVRERQYLFLSFLPLTRRRQARGKRKENRERDAVLHSLLDTFTTGYARRLRVLRCMTLDSLTPFAYLHCLGHFQFLSIILHFFCLLMILFCQSAVFFLVPFLYSLYTTDGGAFSGPRLQQRRLKASPKQRLQQRRFCSRWRLKDIFNPKSIRGTLVSHGLPSGVFSCGYLFAKKQLFLGFPGKGPQAGRRGDSTERRAASEKLAVIMRELFRSRVATEKHSFFGADDKCSLCKKQGEEGEKAICYFALSSYFQEMNKQNLLHYQFCSSAAIVYTLSNLSHSADGSHLRCASASSALVLWATCTHPPCISLLLYIGSYFAWRLGFLERLQLLKTSVASRIYWRVALLLAVPSLSSPMLLLPWAYAAEFCLFLLLDMPTAFFSHLFVLGSLLRRRISSLPRRGTCEPGHMRAQTSIPSFFSSSLTGDPSSSRYFASFCSCVLAWWLCAITSPPSVSMHFFNALVLQSSCLSAPRSYFSCRLFSVVFCSAFTHAKGWRMSIFCLFVVLRSTATFSRCCRFCILREHSAAAALGVSKAEFAAKLFFLPFTTTFSRPALACWHSRSQRLKISDAAYFDKISVAAADATFACAACSYRFSELCHLDAVRTGDAVNALVAESIALAGAAAAGSKEVAGLRKTGFTAYFPAPLLFGVSTAEHALRWLRSTSVTVSFSQKKGSSLGLWLDPAARKHHHLLSPFAWMSSAVFYLAIIFYTVFSHPALNFGLRHRRCRTGACCAFSRANFILPSPSWASLLQASRPRCWSVVLSPLAMLLVLLLLLSWIASSVEFTVTSDVDQNIFLDLSGGLPQAHDSLLIRMAAGRRFSILNFEKQTYELKPTSFRSEAFQILFGSAADKESLTNPLACDVSLPHMRYTSYFIFASPLGDFWDVLPATDTSPQSTGTSTAPVSGFDIYRFSWPRGYQAASLGTGLCIQVVEKNVPTKHVLNVMFLASSAFSVSSSAIISVPLWSALSLAVALLPFL